MTYTVKVDMENLSPGAEVELHGLGIFKNGKSAKLKDDVVAQFESVNGPLLEAYENSYGVTIEDSEAEPEPEPEEEDAKKAAPRKVANKE